MEWGEICGVLRDYFIWIATVTLYDCVHDGTKIHQLTLNSVSHVTSRASLGHTNPGLNINGKTRWIFILLFLSLWTFLCYFIIIPYIYALTPCILWILKI
uniref:Uncharacterized protein n=1 Tax=Gossypium raimondii TaxID=29730 RepID=A0A0D2UTY9_GOSRA|nr:hypothetical protein B456_011G141700 [Gossypium raimondii]